MDTYKKYRHIIGFQKSKKYLQWVKSKYPGMDLHHILGSEMAKKHTDYLIVPVEHKYHLEYVESHKEEFFYQSLKQAQILLIGYATEALGMWLNEFCDLEYTKAEDLAEIIKIIHKNEK